MALTQSQIDRVEPWVASNRCCFRIANLLNRGESEETVLGCGGCPVTDGAQRNQQAIGELAKLLKEN